MPLRVTTLKPINFCVCVSLCYLRPPKLPRLLEEELPPVLRLAGALLRLLPKELLLRLLPNEPVLRLLPKVPVLRLEGELTRLVDVLVLLLVPNEPVLRLPPKVPVLRELPVLVPVVELEELRGVNEGREVVVFVPVLRLPKEPVRLPVVVFVVVAVERLPPNVPVDFVVEPTRLVDVLVLVRAPPKEPCELPLMSPRFTVTRVLLLRPVVVERAPLKSPRS